MIITKKTRATAACLLAILILPMASGCVIGLPSELSSVLADREAGLYIGGERFELPVPESGSYFYDQLTEVEKRMYAASLTALEAGFNVYELVGVNCDEYAASCKRSTDALLRDHPEFFWIDGGNQVRLTTLAGQSEGTVEITLTEHAYWYGKDIPAARRELEDAACELIAKLGECTDDYGKVKFLNDWLAQCVEYDDASFNYPSEMNEADDAFVNSIYGTLIARKTLCGGYANTFSYILNRIGIETLYVTGTTSDGLHAWNAVNIGGEYYQIDVTWADDNDNDRVVYSYFCLEDEEMSLTHTTDDLFQYPPATGTQYNYYHREGLYLDSYSFNKFNSLFTEYAFERGFSVKFPNEVVLRAAVRDIIDNSKFYKLQGMADEKSFSYVIDDVHCILTLYP